MARRMLRLTAVAAAVFLAGCDNDINFPPQVPPAPPGPAVTDSYLVTSGNRLLGFNRLLPSSVLITVPITGLETGENVVDLAFRPNDGLLYGLVTGGAAPRLVTINTTTGATTAVSTLIADAADASAPFAGLSGTAFGIDFNPVPDRLRVISDAGQNLRINVETGATITDGTLMGDGSGASGTAYTNAFNSACRTAQFAIDPGTDQLFQQNPPNDGLLTAIGALGVDVVSVGGFDIATTAVGGNSAFAVLNTADGAGFYTVSTMTGAAELVSAIALNDGETAAGFATRALNRDATQAPGELLALTSEGGFATFNRAAPGKLCTSGSVSGLPADVTLVGLDTQPATGTVVGVGSDSKLYSVGTDGVAAELCDLVADPSDTTAPFAGLPAMASYGVGFNPVPDRLRVTTSTGLNLRINANPNAAGACLTITDTALTGGMSVDGAAYTNTVPTTASTALYAIDSGNDRLVRIGNDPANGTPNDPGNPNSGIVTGIGPLGVAVGADNAFVIDGRTNAALLVASTSGDDAASTLYTVNLGTGAATLGGVIGGALETTELDGTVTGMALTTGRALTVHALTSNNRLLRFSQTGNAYTPNLTTETAVTGLMAGEELLGIDVRPATGQLVGVTTMNRLYEINPMTGLAVLSATLSSAPTNTVPFAGLTAGARTGVDFNPVPDRLRIVDTTGINLRINVGNGVTLTDGALNGAATTGILGAAYTNSFAGTTTTTLFNLDATTLFQQTPPNDGTLVSVGSTGVTAVGEIGFDIAGGANGIVLAAIETASSTPSSDLYRINLATGVATPVILFNGFPVAGGSRIGPALTPAVRSLAIDLR